MFNELKTDYGREPLLLGQDPGLVDSIHKNYPTIFKLYKKLKSLDWDENEFDFSTCKKDFLTCDKNISDIMLKTLAWQWEADSVVNRSVTAIGAQFTSNSELWALWQGIGLNETLHALTYSEIVRGSFDDPDVIIQEILQVSQAKQRLKPLVDAMDEAYEVSIKIASGQISRDSDEAMDAVLLFVSSLYILERMQFISSFVVTFAIAELGVFLPIGKAVQKICQDEFEIHAVADVEILRITLATTRGQDSLARVHSRIKDMLISSIETERAWTQFIFSEGRNLPGLDAEKLFSFVLYCAKEINDFFNFNLDYPFPSKMPLKFIEKWINLGAMQSSPQEEKPANYMLGMITRELGDEILDFED
jgi:ribonucleoside-diphosphate reductase beta chain